MIVLFRKFGWVLALFVVLLFLVAAALEVIKKPNQSLSDNSESKLIQKERKDQVAPGEEKIEVDEKKEKAKVEENKTFLRKDNQEAKNNQEANSSVEPSKTDQTPDKVNQLQNNLKNASPKTEIDEPDIVTDLSLELVEPELEFTTDIKKSPELEILDPSATESFKEDPSSGSDKATVDSKPQVALPPDGNSNDTGQESSVEVNIMRVDEQGGTLVAGKTKPKTTVEVLVGSKVIGSTESDKEGEFVVMGDLEPSSESQTLTVRSIEEESESNEVSNERPKKLEQTKTEPKELQVNQPEVALSEQMFVILPVSIKNTSDSKIERIKAPIIVQSSSNDIKIVQKIEIINIEEIIIDSISYSDLGEAVLVGRANPSNTVLVYLDNVLRTSSEVGASGGWSTELTGLEPGLYELRLDEVDASGAVKSRIMTPFKKESKDFLMNMVSGSITVQTGNSLWRIARRIFGRGIRYIEIYEKNDHLIKDPNLIYPGQVFSIPTKN